MQVVRFFLRALSMVCAALLSLFGCAPDDALDDGAPSVAATDEIVGGRRDRAAHPAVLAIAIGDRALCTGTLIAPNLILTARHCVSEVTERVDCASPAPQVLSDYAPSQLTVLSGDDARGASVIARGARVLVPRGRTLCGADVAVIVLDRALSAIAPMRVDATAALSVGDRLTVVGFGARGSEVGAPYGVRYQRSVSVVDWSAREFVAGRSVCSGDSGGPAIDARTGAVVGVLSRGSDPCTARDATAIWTHVSVAKSLIAAARRDH